MKKMISSAIMVGAFSVQLFAGEHYTLESAKETVVNDNIQVSIAYENYVLVKNQERTKALQLLPSLSVNLILFNYKYGILQSIIPEPSKFFQVAAQKDLAKAANVNKTIVKKNLLEDLEETLFLFQYHKELSDSFNREADIRSAIATRSQEAYDLGAIDFTNYYASQRNVINAKSQAVSGAQLAHTEEFSLKLILQVKDNSESLDIDHLDFYNQSLDFPKTAQEAAIIAVNNSKEVEQFDDLIAAAKKQKRGTAISFISWGGVGFDYFSNISIANLEVKKIELQRLQAVIEVQNQVVAQYAEIQTHKDQMAIQDQLLAMANKEYSLAITAQTDLLNSFVNTKNAELNLMQAQRESLRLKYELEVKYIKLKRLIGTNMLTNEVPRS